MFYCTYRLVLSSCRPTRRTPLEAYALEQFCVEIRATPCENEAANNEKNLTFTFLILGMMFAGSILEYFTTCEETSQRFT